MVPPIEVSVARVNPNRWILGSSIICESVEDQKLKPTNTIVNWQDNGRTFYLQENTDSSTLAGDVEIDRIHFAGTSAAVWSIGNNVICKVHAWCEGLELEANTIRFVREHAGELPIPQVIHTWIDYDFNRTFLIIKRVSGQTLQQAWPRLKLRQRKQIANDIAQYCDILATKTSSLFETATGCGVYEPRLMENPPESHPTWLPYTMGPFSSEAIFAYMTKISTKPSPKIDALFYFYHADLGPTNIMISEEGSLVTGIIDWESGAYYPRFYIVTKPAISSAYYLNRPTEQQEVLTNEKEEYEKEGITDDEKLWGRLLSEALKAKGLGSPDETFLPWFFGTFD